MDSLSLGFVDEKPNHLKIGGSSLFILIDEHSSLKIYNKFSLRCKQINADLNLLVTKITRRSKIRVIGKVLTYFIGMIWFEERYFKA